MELTKSNYQTWFKCWCQKTLPAVYDPSLTYYEQLCKVHQYLTDMENLYNDVVDQVNKNTADIKTIQQLFKEFVESGFDDYYQQQVEQWINVNLSYIFGQVIRQVYFGINLEGYFVAYVPQSWDDITFDTGMVYAEDTYGRLILRWDADSPYTVNQNPEKRRNPNYGS